MIRPQATIHALAALSRPRPDVIIGKTIPTWVRSSLGRGPGDSHTATRRLVLIILTVQCVTLPTGDCPASAAWTRGRKPVSPGCQPQLIQIICTDDVYRAAAALPSACLLSIRAKLTPSIWRIEEVPVCVVCFHPHPPLLSCHWLTGGLLSSWLLSRPSELQM